MSESNSDISEQQKLEYPNTSFIVPSTKQQLRMCLQCGMIKSKQQWKKDKQCQNCGTQIKINQNYSISNKFNGLIALIDPKNSFIRKKANIYTRKGMELKAAAYGL